MKKIHFFFAVWVALALQLAAWGATETVEGITWTYTVSYGTASMGSDEGWWDEVYHGQAVPTSTIGAIAIPSSLGGYPVRSIGEWAFYDCCSLTSVTIPDSVTSIGNSAFSGCRGLTSVTIGNSVTNIGPFAFEGCSSLEAFSVADENPAYKAVSGFLLTKDGKTLIGGLNGDVVIPDGVTSIGNYAFSGCSGLTSVTIPDSVTSIGNYAFSGCSGLTNVTIPDSVTSIGERAFRGCSGLTSVTIPNSVTSIGNAAFYGCSGLTSVTIPDSVTSIGTDAFSGCSGLASVTIPDSVTSIGEGAFYGCSGLASVTIPDSVTSIEWGAFSGCSGLTSVTIPDSVTSIGNSAFSGCSGLTRVTIGNGVTSIGWRAFSGCSGLTSVTIGNGVTSIVSSAFYGCSGLTSVTIPDSVTSIGWGAFYGCSGLTSVTIGNRVTSIVSDAFSGCNLCEVVFKGNMPEGLPGSGLPLGEANVRVCYPEEFGAEWMRYLARDTIMDFAHEPSPEVEILSVQMRTTDPTIMDVVYKVTSTKETVNVRALAFEDGERSFAKVVRPETFVEGTGANLGDGVAANVEHTVSWRVSADWAVDLAKVSFEILVSDEGQLPVELVTIPAVGTNAEMTINVRRPMEADLFNALLWHYANHAEGLTVVDGELKQGTTTLANGASLANSSAACGYVYGKMGYDLLSGDALTYARSATRWPLTTTTTCQYGVLRAAGE